MNELTTKKSNKDGWLYTILLLFLGWLGVHRFYIRKIGTGIAYMLTGGFLSIGLLVDAIVLMVGTVKDKDGAKVGIEVSSKVLVAVLLVAAVISIILWNIVVRALLVQWGMGCMERLPIDSFMTDGFDMRQAMGACMRR